MDETTIGTLLNRPISSLVVTPEGSGIACLHCAGKGYRVAQHEVPWLTDQAQGTHLYRTKLCCLECGGLGYAKQDPVDPPEAIATTPVISEPYIDVEFQHEE